MFLRNRYLNTSAIHYDKPDEKSAAEIEREEIPVEEIKKEEAEQQEQDQEEADGEPDTDKEDDNESGKDDEAEAKKEEDEEVEETAEQKAIREADEAANADNKSKRQIQRMQKRIDALTAKSRNTEAEKTELQKLLDAKKEDGTLTLTEDEVERRAELKAEQKLADREFKKAINSLATDANKLDKQFNTNIHSVTSEIGLLPPVMIGILEDLENDAGKKVGAEVLVYLSKNIDDYEDIYGLSEGRMALKLQSLANKITKKAAKPVSQVPKPNEPVSGNRVNSQLNDKMTDEDWIAKREAELNAKRRA